MRKIALAVTAVAALSAGLQTPAFAAAPDAPTDFTIAIQDLHLQLAWKDDNAKNIVYVEQEGQAPYVLTTLAETAANQFALPAFRLKESDKTRLIVKSEVNGELSEGAVSAWFDTHRPAAPVLQDANPDGQNTKLTWTLAAVADSTPNDPLDVAGTGTVRATTSSPGGHSYSQDFPAGSTSGVVSAHPRPSRINLSAWNEWGGSSDAVKVVRLGTLGAGITVPAKAVYGARLGIKSTLDLFTSEGREERASGIKVELQARGKTTDAWKTYGRYDGNTTTAFDTGIAALGNRQYRLFVPARKVVSGNVIVLTPATSTSAKSSTTSIKFVSAGFTPGTVKPYGDSSLTAKIQPAATVKGMLQYYNSVSKKWINALPVQFKNGALLVRDSAGDTRGTTHFRINLPAITVGGLTLSATTSATFGLTIK
ncbi:hypothetical protein E1263_23745 [Kribbella antibiotica]|uniref:Uncharacterized protein n=1 Tax=Kribbella antibiotica TaxID=190195 RepID=A0A4R4ZHE6_9ACTN|nr:hypothetical protein [Kribbella antibiotica]TDD57466.1 hypothetical protein E1263_23745 [Kribbella antibiotica]